jgi:hypothetical protein
VIGLVVAVLCGTWLIVAVAMGRGVYRAECSRIIRKGRRVSDLDRRRAVDMAMEMIYAWPLTLLLAGYEALITWERTPHSCGDCAAPVLDVIDTRPERDGTDELIDRLDRELYPAAKDDQERYLALKYGPRNVTHDPREF